jgi:hypothetical protein
MSQQNIDLLISPREFFHEKITEASKYLNVALDEHVEFYLVNLLSNKVSTSAQSSTDAINDDFLSTPLAFMLKNAVEAPSEHQSTLYRKLGDASLYVSGFFQDYFNRKTFDINYYITMGASAYEQASVMSRNYSKDDGLSETFNSLSKNFIQIVDVVAQASDTTAMHHDSSILSLYDRWNRSGSERLRNILEDKGINPIKVPFKQAQ